MDNSTRFEPHDELARFDYLLTRIDPSLNADAFNKFMQRPALSTEISPQSKDSNDKPLIKNPLS